MKPKINKHTASFILYEVFGIIILIIAVIYAVNNASFKKLR